MNKKYIWITFQKEGTHCYPDAATNPLLATGGWDDVSFLALPHRHIFHFRVTIEVFHNDRDLEFIQVKRQCEKWFESGSLDANSKSCEMLGDDLYKLISEKWPERDVTIEVSEDGENGCRLVFPRKPKYSLSDLLADASAFQFNDGLDYEGPKLPRIGDTDK